MDGVEAAELGAELPRSLRRLMGELERGGCLLMSEYWAGRPNGPLERRARPVLVARFVRGGTGRLCATPRSLPTKSRS